MVVALIALFVALGGTSYAAITALPAHSVGTAQLKNKAVTAAKIKNGSITPEKLSPSSLAGAIVGTPGAPAYASGWGDPGSGDEGVSFYIDPWGIVHLQGSASYSGSAVTGTIFTLPPGFRPAGALYFPAYGSAGSAAYIEVMSNGDVVEFDAPQDYVGLSNITFLAGL